MFAKCASAINLDGARAGLEKATSWPRAANSRAIGKERVIRPRSFVGRVVSRSFTAARLPGHLCGPAPRGDAPGGGPRNPNPKQSAT